MDSRCRASSSSREIVCIFVIEPSKYPIGSFRKPSTVFAVKRVSFGGVRKIVKGV